MKKLQKALHGLPNDKAPGIDGFPVEFFKANWGVVGDEICKAVKQFFQTDKLLKQVNCNNYHLSA